MPVREGGTLLLLCEGLWEPEAEGPGSAAQTSLAVKRQMWNQLFGGGAWDSAFVTHSQEGLTVLGPRALLGGE